MAIYSPLWVWGRPTALLTIQIGGALLYHHVPLKPDSKQQHWAPDTQSTRRRERLGHYALQPALEHPAEPFISQPASPPFTDLLLRATLMHCLRRTGKGFTGTKQIVSGAARATIATRRRELELTAVFELWTFAPSTFCGSALTQTDGVCATAPLRPLTFCLATRAGEAQVSWEAFTGAVV